MALGVAGITDPRLVPAVVVMALVARFAGGRRARSREQRRGHEHARSLTGTVALLRLAADSGESPRRAIELVAGVEDEAPKGWLSTVARRLEAGAGLDEAIDIDVDRDVARLLRTLASADRDGADWAPLVADVGLDLRRARRAALDVGAQRLGVQIVFPLVLCILPAFLLLSVLPLVLDLLDSIGD